MTQSARTVLVLGAQGVLGSVLATAFADEGWEVVRAGRRPEPGMRLVDLDRPDTLRHALDAIDLVANPVPDERLVAEKIVLERGPVLINMSAVPAACGSQLKRASTTAQGLVLINAGLVPGITSLVAADLLDAHPDADEVELAFTLSAGGTSGRGGAGLIHRYLTSARHHPTFRVNLGPPFGTRTCFEVGAEERGWLADQLLGERGVRLGVYWRERTLEALFRSLNTLHMVGGTPRVTFVAGRRRAPSEATREPICEWVAVNRGGERLAARAIHGRGDYRMTAASTIACAEALLQLRNAAPRRSGVFAPEELFALSELQPAFERLGFGIAER
jgi:NAD(P)-dependent dehydrogenase (short-subunit alcohol dehydrogenase family)